MSVFPPFCPASTWTLSVFASRRPSFGQATRVKNCSVSEPGVSGSVPGKRSSYRYVETTIPNSKAKQKTTQSYQDLWIRTKSKTKANNPHLQTAPKWALNGACPRKHTRLRRRGWSRRVVQIGEQTSVVAAPRKNSNASSRIGVFFFHQTRLQP